MSNRFANVAEDEKLRLWSEFLSEKALIAAHRDNEMGFRESFHVYVVEAIKDLFNMDLSAVKSEFNTTAAPHNRKPVDVLYGSVAVEWEFDMGEARREHGATQALDYLSRLRNKYPTTEPNFTVIVSDGKQWGVLTFDPQTTPTLFDPEPPSTSAGHFTWFPTSPGVIRRFLELIGSHQKSPITPKVIANKFGPQSAVAKQLVPLFAQLIATRSAGSRIDTLYLEWRRALDIVYGNLDSKKGNLVQETQELYGISADASIGELLFALHSYFALVSRLIAVELLAVVAESPSDRPTNWRSLQDEEFVHKVICLERGELPGGIEISNLFETDVFSWWGTDAADNRDILEAINRLIDEVGRLAFPHIAYGSQHAGDVLRDLYENIVPTKMRKALGEFLTPHWLAQASLERMASLGANLDNGRILDPTCGTGTFLVPVISRRLRRLTTQSEITAADVQQVLDTVAGIDLNPIAVTAARVNYALALGSLAKKGSLTLPVWRADSLVVPEMSPAQGSLDNEINFIPHLELKTSLPQPFAIPTALATVERMRVLREIIETHIVTNTDFQSLQHAIDSFELSFHRQFGKESPDYLGKSFSDSLIVARYLFEQICELAAEHRDAIWARLIENSYAPLFAGEFDIIVGNPPWLSWPNLPAEWRQKTETLWRAAGLWTVPRMPDEPWSNQFSDIATLVFAVSLMRYAKQDALVGLLTPKSLIQADPGNRAFRKFILKPEQPNADGTEIVFCPIWCDDWEKLKPFQPGAANKPIFLVVRRDSPWAGTTPGAVWELNKGKRPNRNTWPEYRKYLQESLGNFSPVTPALPHSAWTFRDINKPALLSGGVSAYQFGEGVNTRGAAGVYLVNVSKFEPRNQTQPATIEVVNDPDKGEKPVVVARHRIEADLVYPLIRGRDVKKWVATPSEYMVVPHDPENLNKPLTEKQLITSFHRTLDWLTRNKQVLAARRPYGGFNFKDNNWWKLQGDIQLMQSGFVVAVPEFGKRPVAAIIRSKFLTQLSRSVVPLLNHKVMFHTISTEVEALYLAAMINSTPIQDLCESFVSSTSVSPTALKKLPIPRFDANNTQMVKLVELARQADRNPQLAETLQLEMDAEVLLIVNTPHDYDAALKHKATKPDFKPQPADMQLL